MRILWPEIFPVNQYSADGVHMCALWAEMLTGN